jgi:hypothetical protein
MYPITIVAPISLEFPDDYEYFGTCSIYSDPPLFGWKASEPFSLFDIQFSEHLSFDDVLQFEVMWPKAQLSLSREEWKEILLITGALPAGVYWRVVGKREDGTVETSDVQSIAIRVDSAGGPNFSPTNRRSKPTLTWQTNCNTRFKVVFSSDSSFSKKTYSFGIEHPSGAEGTVSKTLTTLQWLKIKMLVKNKKGSTIYWYIESWDVLERHANSDVMSFVLAD